MKRGMFLLVIILLSASTSAFTVAGRFNIGCGNNIIEAGEECDLMNITSSCSSLGYNSGSISCTKDCRLNESLCAIVQQGGSSGGGGSIERTLIRECNDGKDNDEDGRIDYLSDYGCTNILDNSEFEICFSNWTYSDWSNCMEGIQERVFIDTNDCRDERIERKNCEVPITIYELPIIGQVPGWFLIIMLIILIVILILSITIYYELKKRRRLRKRKRK